MNEDHPTMPDVEPPDILGLRADIPSIVSLNGNKQPKPYPLTVALGAIACVLALIAIIVAGMSHSTTVRQTVNQDVSKQQAAKVAQLQNEVTALQGQTAAQAAKIAKLTTQLGSVTGLSRFGDNCTEPGFDFPCAPLG